MSKCDICKSRNLCYLKDVGYSETMQDCVLYISENQNKCRIVWEEPYDGHMDLLQISLSCFHDMIVNTCEESEILFCNKCGLEIIR